MKKSIMTAFAVLALITMASETSKADCSWTVTGTVKVQSQEKELITKFGPQIPLKGIKVKISGATIGGFDEWGTVTTDAISLNNVDGAGTFSGGTVGVLGTSGASSDGIAITGGSAATFTFGTTTIDDTGADAINLNGANGAVTFSSVNLDGMLGNGISITGNTNAVSVNGGSIGVSNDAALNSVDISGGNGTITIAASSTKAAGNDLLEITGRTGGTVTISGTQSGTVSGIDINGDGTIDLQLNTNPNHKDVFVEADALSAYAPMPGVISDVVAAFAAAPNALVKNPDGLDGVTLHVQVDETNIPTADWVADGPNSFPNEYDPTKDNLNPLIPGGFGSMADRASPNAANILAARKLVYHYSIFLCYIINRARCLLKKLVQCIS